VNEGIEVKALASTAPKSGRTTHEYVQISDTDSNEAVCIECINKGTAERLANRLKDVIEDGGAA
jgi:hypothetical protein